MFMITLSRQFFVSYIKDNLLNNTLKDLELHCFSDQGTIIPISTFFGHSEPILTKNTDDMVNVSPLLS